MLWDDPVVDNNAALRRERYKLRKDLRRLVLEVTADPVPGDEAQGEAIVTLDPEVMASDVHEFTELLRLAETLPPAAAIAAYEAALRVYQGDLLDSPAVRMYSRLVRIRYTVEWAQVAQPSPRRASDRITTPPRASPSMTPLMASLTPQRQRCREHQETGVCIHDVMEQEARANARRRRLAPDQRVA
jgi:hypothetical protein